MNKKTVWLVATCFIVSTLVLAACGQAPATTPPTTTPTPKEVELKYDDGFPDDSQAMRGWGYLVQFSPPPTPFTITKVRIYGKLYGTGYENLTFTVQIWDKDSKEIHSASYPHTKFSVNSGWVEIDIPNIAVNYNFYVHVVPGSPREGGITIYYDSSVKNEHSELTNEWKVIDWSSPFPTKETVNWMIRVVGTTR